MKIIIQATQFLLSLSLLIILHELGHFIPAKLFKTKVEKFYLFFDYKFSLFKKKIGETVYGIGWIPLGGYVKIAGMIDESLDTDQMKEEPKPWEFRSKPAWQRLIIMVGGVTVNVILAIVIYIGMFMYYGEEVLPIKNIEQGLMVGEKGKAIGLETGDLVVSVDGKQLTRFNEIDKELVLSESSIGIIRNGEAMEIQVNPEDKAKLLEGDGAIVQLRFPFVIESFGDTSAAKEAGVEVGDWIKAVNDQENLTADMIPEIIPEHAEDTIQLGILRGDEYLTISVVVPETGKIGIKPQNKIELKKYFQLESQKFTLAEAIPAGWNKTTGVLKDYIRQLKMIFTPSTGAYKKVGGFIAIASQFPNEWDWEWFWGITAFLSIMLAFLNILPIPALDGGHVVFVLIEMITGRKPSDKVLEYAQMVGFFILLALIVLANGNDILGLFK